MEGPDVMTAGMPPDSHTSNRSMRTVRMSGSRTPDCEGLRLRRRRVRREVWRRDVAEISQGHTCRKYHLSGNRSALGGQEYCRTAGQSRAAERAVHRRMMRGSVVRRARHCSRLRRHVPAITRARLVSRPLGGNRRCCRALQLASHECEVRHGKRSDECSERAKLHRSER
jgi:hypothetical protein